MISAFGTPLIEPRSFWLEAKHRSWPRGQVRRRSTSRYDATGRLLVCGDSGLSIGAVRADEYRCELESDPDGDPTLRARLIYGRLCLMAEPNSGDQAVERVWRAMPDGARKQLEQGIAPTDLQSLLIGIAGARAARVRPADLITRWRRDRFVQPSRCDPRRLNALESLLWQLLPEGFAGVELSPVAPLGSCVAVAPVSQNRIVTTVRLSEVISDAANALAIEAAVRRLEQDSSAAVHLAAAHRHMRAQAVRAWCRCTFPPVHACLECARHWLCPHAGRTCSACI